MSNDFLQPTSGLSSASVPRSDLSELRAEQVGDGEDGPISGFSMSTPGLAHTAQKDNFGLTNADEDLITSKMNAMDVNKIGGHGHETDDPTASVPARQGEEDHFSQPGGFDAPTAITTESEPGDSQRPAAVQAVLAPPSSTPTDVEFRGDHVAKAIPHASPSHDLLSESTFKRDVPTTSTTSPQTPPQLVPTSTSLPQTPSAPAITEPTHQQVVPTTTSLPQPQLQVGEGKWKLKSLMWPDPRVGAMYRREVKVLTQNANGPCSLLALANVLILRGSIHIPSSYASISYSQLSHLIGDWLVTRQDQQSETAGKPKISLSAALDILPTTTRGLDVNVGFGSIWSFHSANAGTSNSNAQDGELALFDLAGVELVHGWLADESFGEQWDALRRAGGTYDGAQMAIVDAAEAEAEGRRKREKEGGVIGKEEARKIKDSLLIQDFLTRSSSQITYPGLFALTALEPGSVVAFFRNSHLSVLYRRHNPTDPSDDNPTCLYQLVTDFSFVNEPEVCWESIVDVDGAGTSFFNSDFYPSGSAGGDYSGMSAQQAVARATIQGNRDDAEARGEFGDEELARALQAEEDAITAQRHQDQEQARRRDQVRLPAGVQQRAEQRTADDNTGRKDRKDKAKTDHGGKGKEKDKKCMIM